MFDDTNINYPALDKIIKNLSENDAKKLAKIALYHLITLSGSRNSFSGEYLQTIFDIQNMNYHDYIKYDENGKAFINLPYPQRDPIVEELHNNIVQWLNKILKS